MPKLTPRWTGDKEPVLAYRDKDLAAFRKTILEASKMWSEDMLAAEGGDLGTCVVGAGLGVYYTPPRCRTARRSRIIASPGQSDCKGSVARAQKHLEEAGLEIHFEYGNMD